MFPKLEELNEQHGQAFLTAISDYQRHDPETYRLLYQPPKTWDQKVFLNFVKECERQRMDWRPKANKVSTTFYVLRDTPESIAGIGRLRFPLNEEMEQNGGNLYIDVPPSKRKQGYGTLTLNRLLFEAARAGLARALVTSPPENIAAIKIIEKNRGVLEGPQQNPLRFWIRLR